MVGTRVLRLVGTRVLRVVGMGVLRVVGMGVLRVVGARVLRISLIPGVLRPARVAVVMTIEPMIVNATSAG